PPPGTPLRRHHHRPDPGKPEPPHRHRAPLQESPRQGATRLPRHPPTPTPPTENVTPGRNDAAVVSIGEAARQLGVSSATIYRWLRDGFVTGEQLTPGAPWQIRVDQQLRDRIRPQAPDGWLPLSQAASHLGIARQTVLHKVQRGELNAVYLTQGRRKGLRIQVGRGQAGLFDTP